MADEHPVVTLLIARMTSHPEEFFTPPLRWEVFVNDARTHATPEDREKLQAALSAVCMDRLHANVIDELLNGDERRAALAEQQQQQARAASVQNVARQQAKANALAQGYGSQAPLTAMTAAELQHQMNTMGTSMQNLFNQAQPSLGIVDSQGVQQSLTGDDLRQMKGLLGKRADRVILDDPFAPGEWRPLMSEPYPTNKGTLLGSVKSFFKGGV